MHVSVYRSRARPRTGAARHPGTQEEWLGNLPLLALGGFGLEALGDGARNEIADRPAHQRDLAHERARDMAHAGARRQEHGVDVRRHGPVHARHLHLVVEVRAVAEAAEDNGRLLRARRIDGERVERDDLDLAARGLGDGRGFRFEHLDPLRRGEERHLARMHPDADHEPVDHACSPRDDVDVALGRRIEGAGGEASDLHGSQDRFRDAGRTDPRTTRTARVRDGTGRAKSIKAVLARNRSVARLRRPSLGPGPPLRFGRDAKWNHPIILSSRNLPKANIRDPGTAVQRGLLPAHRFRSRSSQDVICSFVLSHSSVRSRKPCAQPGCPGPCSVQIDLEGFVAAERPNAGGRAGRRAAGRLGRRAGRPAAGGRAARASARTRAAPRG